MNHAQYAIAHEIKIRRWQTFTPPQSTAHAAHCGLVLHWRAYYRIVEGRNVIEPVMWKSFEIGKSKIAHPMEEL
jgi:hypothetical protein